MEEQKINQNIVKTLYDKRIKILITTLVFFIGAITITFFIPKKYMAYGVVYSTNSNSIKDVVKNPSFGFDVQADRLIQLFESEGMKKKIIKEFDLINYYELDTTSKGWIYTLNKNYSQDINFNRTRYLSVAIQANMKSSQMAADIVNRLIELIDTVRQEVFNTNSDVLLDTYKQKVEKQKGTVSKLLVQIYESEKSKGKANRLSDNRLKQIEERQKNGNTIKGDELIKDLLTSNYTLKKEELINEYYHELGILNRLKSEYTSIKETVELPFPSIYKVSSAEADEKKVSPSLTVNAILGLVIGLLFSITLVIVPARLKEILNQVKA